MPGKKLAHLNGKGYNMHKGSWLLGAVNYASSIYVNFSTVDLLMEDEKVAFGLFFFT